MKGSDPMAEQCDLDPGFETRDIMLAVWLFCHGYKAELKVLSPAKVTFNYEDIPATLLWKWSAGQREIPDVIKALTYYGHLRRLSRAMRIKAFGREAALTQYKISP